MEILKSFDFILQLENRLLEMSSLLVRPTSVKTFCTAEKSGLREEEAKQTPQSLSLIMMMMCAHKEGQCFKQTFAQDAG